MKDHYSIAICFPEDITEEIGKMKVLLRKMTKWYSSVNAKAHITINKFDADEKTLATWETYLAHFCKYNSPFEIRLTKTGTYPHGTFYLYPDEVSKEIMVRLMKDFHQGVPYTSAGISTDPHVSIGRKLTGEQLQVAEKLWGNESFDMRSICDKLTIRKFDRTQRQYSIYKHFNFEGKEQPTLFS